MLTLALVAAVAMGKKTREELEEEASFAQFTSKFNKHYADLETYEQKFENWRENDKLIKELNEKADQEAKNNPGSEPAHFGYNEFADETLEQLKERGLLGDAIVPENYLKDNSEEDSSDDESSDEESEDELEDDSDGDDRRLLQKSSTLPSQFYIWDKVHLRLGDQGDCLSSWALAANIAFEGAIFMKTEQMVQVSDQ